MIFSWSAKRFLTGCLLALGALGLSGCITETESVFTEQASPKKALEQRVELARSYIGQGNWEDAKRNLQVAAQLDGKNPEVYEAFALVYQSTGEYERAEENFELAISLNSNFSRARNNYAAFLYGQQRYEEAEKQLVRVVKDTLYNARPQAFLNLGLSRLRLEDSEGAEEAFRRTLSMQPRNSTALLELAQLRLEAGDSRDASIYYGQYRKQVLQPSARALWLGIRLARENGDENGESSHALALRNMFPESAEYEAYKRLLE
ncbi:MAG: type IV pilus biogenesis/stability protein PilW [Congregibacter sp.]